MELTTTSNKGMRHHQGFQTMLTFLPLFFEGWSDLLVAGTPMRSGPILLVLCQATTKEPNAETRQVQDSLEHSLQLVFAF